jgi:hypothetical protein
MASTLHDTFISRVAKEIENELRRLAGLHVEAQSFIEDIEHVCGRMYFPGDDDDDDDNNVGQRVPDARFQHRNATYPGVIIEVSYSQTLKSLVNLAEKYLLRSDGRVRIVVGLKLDYQKSKQAWFSIWRLKTSNINGQPQRELETVVKDKVSCRITRSKAQLIQTSSSEM